MIGYRMTLARRRELLENYARGWDWLNLSVVPERCEHLNAPLSPEGRLPGVIQLSNRKKVTSNA